MDFKSTQKFVLTSPKKLREVTRILPKGDVERLISIMPHIEKRAAEPILKVLKSAVANAKQQGVDVKDLILKEIQIGEGPRLKRGRAGARGRLKPYKKRMSHIMVILAKKEVEDRKSEILKNQAAKVTKKGNSAVKVPKKATRKNVKGKRLPERSKKRAKNKYK